MTEQLRTAAALINFAVNSTVYLRTGHSSNGELNAFIDSVRLRSQVDADRQIKLDYSYHGTRHIATGVLKKADNDSLQVCLPLADMERLHEVYGIRLREIVGDDFDFGHYELVAGV